MPQKIHVEIAPVARAWVALGGSLTAIDKKSPASLTSSTDPGGGCLGLVGPNDSISSRHMARRSHGICCWGAVFTCPSRWLPRSEHQQPVEEYAERAPAIEGRWHVKIQMCDLDVDVSGFFTLAGVDRFSVLARCSNPGHGVT